MTDPNKALLVAKYVHFPDGSEFNANWRIVHKGVCNPQEGVSYQLIRYTGSEGIARFNRLVSQGALKGSGQDKIDRLRDLLRQFPDRIEDATGLTGRFAILKRDGYRCRICGRTADDGVKLEVDHRIPRSKGGSDIADNLWTLCFDCNRGKRDNIL